MTVWAAIDAKCRQHKAELETTRDCIRQLGGAYVRADELGWWKCSYRPTVGDRLQVTLRARSSAELIAQMQAVVEARNAGKPKWVMQ